jgi:hypothetical protein
MYELDILQQLIKLLYIMELYILLHDISLSLQSWIMLNELSTGIALPSQLNQVLYSRLALLAAFLPYFWVLNTEALPPKYTASH